MTIKNLCAEGAERTDTTKHDNISNFEAGFRYPLSPNEHFSISHGADYSLFYRSMGKSLVLAAEQDEIPIATVAATIRELQSPGGTIHRCAYIGDLKYRKSAGASRKLLSLLLELQDWCIQNADSALSVVMGGTQNLPDSYSGRLGLREMKRLGVMHIYRIPIQPLASCRQFKEAEQIASARAQSIIANNPQNFFCFKPIQNGDSESECTSLISPIWLGTNAPGSTTDLDNGESPSGDCAIGCLQDTRKAKKLFREDGSEILNAHLTNFYFDSIDSAASIIESALESARDNNFEALFLSVDTERSQQLSAVLEKLGATKSEALIYGAGVIAEEQFNDHSNRNWCINSSEV
ncbi:MAG: hypothetical protein R3F51_16880 [Cyanobacteriota/Melainabacteria group bacterium]